MDFDMDAPTNDVIAMNLAVAAIEQWLKNVSADRRGEDLGREIGALYREIHAAVSEMSAGKEEDERRALVDAAVEELQQGLTALGISHWEKK